MDKFLTAVCNYLASQSGIGTYMAGTGSIYQYTLPKSPTDCIAVIPTGGPRPGVVTIISYQVLCRSTTRALAEAKAKLVFLALDEKWNTFTSIPGYSRATHPVGPNYLDDSGSPIFSLNFEFTGVGRKLGL